MEHPLVDPEIGRPLGRASARLEDATPTEGGEEKNILTPFKFLLHPLLSAEPDLNPATNGA